VVLPGPPLEVVPIFLSKVLVWLLTLNPIW
jgi:hypothetical protein